MTNDVKHLSILANGKHNSGYGINDSGTDIDEEFIPTEYKMNDFEFRYDKCFNAVKDLGYSIVDAGSNKLFKTQEYQYKLSSYAEYDDYVYVREDDSHAGLLVGIHIGPFPRKYDSKTIRYRLGLYQELKYQLYYIFSKNYERKDEDE